MKFLMIGLMAVLFLAGCTSAQMRARKEQRDKAAAAAKLYCEFINGEIYPDIDVALNLEMAKRCDSEKPFSISQYRTPSENQGIMYCCATAGKEASVASSSSSAVSTPAAPAASSSSGTVGDPRLKKVDKKEDSKAKKDNDEG